MAVDDVFSVPPPSSVPSSGLDLARLASGRTIEARVASLAEGLALVTTRHGTMPVDLSAFGRMPPAVGEVVRLKVQAVEGGGRPTVTVVERVPVAAGEATAPTVAAEDPILVLARAVRDAAASQTGLAPLYASLAGLGATPAGAVPEPVRALVAQLMGARLGDTAPPTAEAVKKAFLGSGLFLEARSAAHSGEGAAPSDDLKAALSSLRAALAKWLGPSGGAHPSASADAGAGQTHGVAGSAIGGGQGTSPIGAADRGPGATGRPIGAAYGGGIAAAVARTAPPGPDGSTRMATDFGSPGRTLAGVATADTAAPSDRTGATVAGGTASLEAGATGLGEESIAALLKVVVRGLEIAGSLTPLRSAEAGEAAAALAAIGGERDLRPPPPRRGQAPRGQPPAPEERAEEVGVEGLGRRALERTEGALSRILLEQFAALDRRRDDPAQPVEARSTREWTVEMPIATHAGTGVVQMAVERDGGRRRADGSRETPAWRVRFSLDVEPLGPVHTQIGFAGERMSIGLWAERPDTAAALGAEVGRLEGALAAAAVPVESVRLASGRPPSGGSAPSAGRLVDVKL